MLEQASGLGAMHAACLSNRLSALQLLIAAGADVELASRDKAQLLIRTDPLLTLVYA